MFDLNGDGNVDADEFDKVTDLMKQHSSTGNKQETCVLHQGQLTSLTRQFTLTLLFQEPDIGITGQAAVLRGSIPGSKPISLERT